MTMGKTPAAKRYCTLDLVHIPFFSSHMELSDALTKSICLICDRCTGRQLAYVDLMIERHGPDMELKEALKTEPCFWCKKVGYLSVFKMGT